MIPQKALMFFLPIEKSLYWQCERIEKKNCAILLCKSLASAVIPQLMDFTFPFIYL